MFSLSWCTTLWNSSSSHAQSTWDYRQKLPPPQHIKSFQHKLRGKFSRENGEGVGETIMSTLYHFDSLHDRVPGFHAPLRRPTTWATVTFIKEHHFIIRMCTLDITCHHVNNQHPRKTLLMSQPGQSVVPFVAPKLISWLHCTHVGVVQLTSNWLFLLWFTIYIIHRIRIFWVLVSTKIVTNTR